jgi:Mn2+/Fe2+ NRAMP family transporter
MIDLWIMKQFDGVFENVAILLVLVFFICLTVVMILKDRRGKK